MHKRPPGEPDAEVLPEQVASRLLTRASELDAAQRAGSVVAELRAAATEAGISPAAFDAALSELHAGKAQLPDEIKPRRRVPMWAFSAVVAALAIGALFVALMLIPAIAATPPV
ncbi:MAG TPA: hypothetical protein VGQ52_00615 [Gemmatimonadaceae bacterium]|jgi:membrane-bound lytic murein transglycosylase B|nr:hypothetical protein [Gemmatimonadaceae bacterium]